MKICFFSSSESILKFYTACLLSRLTNASDSCDDFGTIHLKKKNIGWFWSPDLCNCRICRFKYVYPTSKRRTRWLNHNNLTHKDAKVIFQNT